MSAAVGPGTSTPPKGPPKSRFRRRLKRAALGLLIATPIVGLGLWIGIHKFEWLGPWLADTGRSIVGNDAIAKLEDWAYGVEDEYNQVTRGDEAPEAQWELSEVPPLPTATPGKPLRYPVFQPTSVGPMLKSFSAPGDGDWVPILDARNPEEPPPAWKTLLHPDPKRGWSVAVVVAIDLRQVDLHLIAGTFEPMSRTDEARGFTRRGTIDPAHIPTSLLAWNGGFKTTHGNYGMQAEGILFVEPRNFACTIAERSGKLVIDAWEDVSSTRESMTWFRQTPACMIQDGVLHRGLVAEDNTLWGATLDRDTVIRRSAIGLSANQETLFVSITEATTAQAIAHAMKHAGAEDVAQLDVNWSFPKLVSLEPKDGDAGHPVARAVTKGFEFTEDDYVRKAMTRDFFYVTRKPPLP